MLDSRPVDVEAEQFVHIYILISHGNNAHEPGVRYDLGPLPVKKGMFHNFLVVVVGGTFAIRILSIFGNFQYLPFSYKNCLLVSHNVVLFSLWAIFCGRISNSCALTIQYRPMERFVEYHFTV